MVATTTTRDLDRFQASTSNEATLDAYSSRLRDGLKRVVELVDCLYNGDDAESFSFEETKETGRVKHILGRLRQSGDYALDLVSTMEIANCLHSGRLGLNIEPLNVGTLLRDIYHLVNDAFVFQKIPIQFLLELDYELPLIQADALRLRQSVINLLTNAIKFTEVGYIRLGAYMDEDLNAVVIYVEDTGAGIPLDEQERVFKEFERGSHNRLGFGLGLALVRGFVKAHGGDVQVRSETGMGSCFKILLPF